MEPCEIGAGGDTTGDSAVCVDVASKLDWANGIGVSECGELDMTCCGCAKQRREEK